MNEMSGKISWSGLCDLSRRLTSGIETSGKRYHSSLVYMELGWPDNSELGERHWEAGEKSHGVYDSRSRTWLGFREEVSRSFRWCSPASLAKLSAYKDEEGGWEIYLDGNDIREDRRASAYFVEFARSVDSGSLSVLSTPQCSHMVVRAIKEEAETCTDDEERFRLLLLVERYQGAVDQAGARRECQVA